MGVARSDAIFIVSIVFCALATVFVALRCISKWGIRRRVDSDDIVAVLAWLVNMGLMIAIIMSTRYGLGKMDADIDPSWAVPLKRSTYAFTTLYNPCLMLTKTAILILYIRMASAHPFLRYASMATMFVVNVSGIVLTFLFIFQCHPVYAAFTSHTGTCLDAVSIYLSAAPITILTDLAILLLPLPIVTGLRMEMRAKVGLVLTFICGGFVTVVDVVRIAYLQSALREEVALTGSNGESAISRPPNFFYDVGFSFMWSGIECSVGLMCCCALVLKPLVQRVRHTGRVYASSGPGGQKASRDSVSPDLYSDITTKSAFIGGGALHGVVSSVRQLGGSGLATGNSNRSPQMPLQAILESTPDVPDHDRMDIYEFFANGPPVYNDVNAARENGPDSRRGMLAFPAIAKVPSRVSTRTRLARRLSVVTPRMFGSSSTCKSPESMSLPAIQQPTQRFFDFVQIGGRKPLTQLTSREAWWSVVFVSSLFLCWGFSYGLLGTLNGKISVVLPHSSPSRDLALQNSYWLGYFVAPPTAGLYVLTRHGFKATFLTGLTVYSCGAMAFWPSSVLASYAGFFVSNFMVAAGLALLETAANPFIALAGPPEHAEARLNLAQALQGLGSVASPILTSRVLFTNVQGRLSLFDTQWLYLAVAIFAVFLALIFFYVPVSEVDDEELERLALYRLSAASFDTSRPPVVRLFNWPRVSIRTLAIVIGVAAMSLYVGGQETLDYFWNPLSAELAPDESAFWSHTAGRAAFCIGRLVGGTLCFVGVPPRYVLVAFSVLSSASTLALATAPRMAGSVGYAPFVLALFFQGPVFPTLFAIALRNLGRWTKKASIAITTAISFAIVGESVAYGAVRSSGNARSAAWVTFAQFAIMTVALSWTLTDVGRRWTDPKWSRVSHLERARDSIELSNEWSVERGVSVGMPARNGSETATDHDTHDGHDRKDSQASSGPDVELNGGTFAMFERELQSLRPAEDALGAAQHRTSSVTFGEAP